MSHLIQDSYKNLDREFERLFTLGEDLDTKKVFSKVTAMVIARCAFVTDVDAFKDSDNELLKTLSSLFEFKIMETLRIVGFLLMPNFLANWFKSNFFNPSTIKYLSQLCMRILEEPSNTIKQEYAVLLHQLTEARKETDSSKGDAAFTDTKCIIANAILLLVAGFETTSCLFFLLFHPHAACSCL